MKPADLYERVTFDPPLETPDGHGGVETGWDTDNRIEARANFRYLRGGETVQASRLQGRQPVVVTLWSSTETRAITPGWRMIDARTATGYNVRSGPVPSDDRRFVEFTCESGVAI